MMCFVLYASGLSSALGTAPIHTNNGLFEDVTLRPNCTPRRYAGDEQRRFAKSMPAAKLTL